VIGEAGTLNRGMLLVCALLCAGCGTHFDDADKAALEALPSWAEAVHVQIALVVVLAEGLERTGQPGGPSTFDVPERAEQLLLASFPGCVTVADVLPDPPVLFVNDQPLANGRDYTFSQCSGPYGITGLSGTVRAMYDAPQIDVTSQGEIELHGYRGTLAAIANEWIWNAAEGGEFALDFTDGTVHSSFRRSDGFNVEWSGLGYGDVANDPGNDSNTDTNIEGLAWLVPSGAFEIDGRRWVADNSTWTVPRDGSRAGESAKYARVSTHCPNGAIGARSADDDESEVGVALDGTATPKGGHVHDSDFVTHDVPLQCDPRP